MPQIVIENLFNLTIDLAPSTSKVIEIIHEIGIDWMHACGKKGDVLPVNLSSWKGSKIFLN